MRNVKVGLKGGVFVGDKEDPGSPGQPLIHLRIPDKKDLFRGNLEILHDRFHDFGMRFGKGYVSSRNHHIEVLFDMEIGQDLPGGDGAIGGKGRMVVSLSLLQEVDQSGFGVQTGIEFLEIDALRVFPRSIKSGTITHQEVQGLPHGVHVDESVRFRAHGGIPNVRHNVAVEAHIGFFGIKKDAIAVESDDLEWSETIARMMRGCSCCQVHLQFPRRVKKSTDCRG